jgi:hypothetical protein
MKIKTSELTGAALDWAVAKCEGKTVTYYGRGLWYGIESGHDYRWEWSPSTNWAQGGPIIEREGVELQCWRAGRRIDHWTATLPFQVNDEGDPFWDGSTPLIAAMRCFCCSKLGDEIDIPEELCQQQNS